MPVPTQFVGTVWQNGPASLLARAYDVSGNLLQQSQINSISANVYYLNGVNVSAIGAPFPMSLTVSSVWYNSLQQNPNLWPVDSVGFNFWWVCPGSAFPQATAYRIDILLTLVDGSQYPLQFVLTADPVP